MAIRANIVLPDALSTPVNHTFVPGAIVQDSGLSIAEYADKVTGINIGYWTLSAGYRKPSKGSPMHRHTFKTALPVLETISGADMAGITPAPSLAFTNQASTTMLVHDRSTGQQRKDLLKIHNGFLASTSVAAQVHSFELPW
jgi:hypothetical protein